MRPPRIKQKTLVVLSKIPRTYDLVKRVTNVRCGREQLSIVTIVLPLRQANKLALQVAATARGNYGFP